jgi:hypothetical protein
VLSMIFMALWAPARCSLGGRAHPGARNGKNEDRFLSPSVNTPARPCSSRPPLHPPSLKVAAVDSHPPRPPAPSTRPVHPPPSFARASYHDDQVWGLSGSGREQETCCSS